MNTCGSPGQLSGRKEQFVGAQILLKGVAARERFAQLRSRQRIIEASERIPTGKHQVRMEFAYDGGGLGKGGLRDQRI